MSRRLENRSITTEKARRERSKSRRKKSGHQETSSDSEHEEGSEDAYGDLNSPYKRHKPTPFTQRITRFKYHRKAKLPRNIRVYEGNKDPEDHLGIFSAVAEQEEWPMPIWCRMFRKTLGGAARNWFDDLDTKSYAKDRTEIHGIKRRQNKGLQAFMDRFKSESSHIKEVLSVLRISAFMHGHGHPELGKKLNDKIPKTVDEMFERVRAFIRGEVAAGSAEMVHPSQGDKGYVRPAWTEGPKKARNRGGPREARRNIGVYIPYPRKDTFTPLTKTPKEILAMESLKKQIEEVVASGKLAHLVKDIRRTNQRNGSQGRNNVNVINMIREGENCKGSFEEERYGLTDELTFPVIPRNQLTDEPIILEGIIEGNRVRRILVDGGSSSETMYEHCLRNLDVSIRLRLRRYKIPMVGLVTPEKTWGREDAKEVFTISHKRPDQYVMIGATLTTNCKQLLANVLRENIEVFTWTRSGKTVVPRFVMEHQLKIYPHVEPMTHKRRPTTPKGRLALKEKVFRWLKEGLIRKVDYSSLNKVCAKDMYPFPEEGEELASLMGYPYKCFLRLPKEYNQIRMAEDDEEKTGFHTEEGDVEETLRKLKRVNIKIDPVTSSFGVKEGRFLGHMITKEGVRADPEKFIPKLAELKNPIRETRLRLETAKGPGWTNEAEEAL
ncbi:hypothetical protein Tco_0201962 [Tanacetum coccineum]